MAKLNALLKAADRSPRVSSKVNSVRSSGWRKNVPSSVKEDDIAQKSLQQADNTRIQMETIRSKKTQPVNPVCTPESESSSESEEKEEEEEEEEMIYHPLSEKEKNEISAKILRAELMDDDELAARLKARLEKGNPASVKRPPQLSVKKQQTKVNTNRESGESSESEGEAVILTRTDKHGNLYPVKLQTSTDKLNLKRKRSKKKVVSTHDTDGKRTRYFEDDDQVDLKTMVEQERLTSSEDQLAMLARLAGKHLGHTQGDDYTLDDMFVAASATKGTTTQEQKRIKEKAAHDHKKRELQFSTCRFCFENPMIAKHLIIAIGIKTYLALPINSSLAEGHCIIVPMGHVTGQTYLDEDVIQEVKVFKKGLSRMFSDKDEDVMFLETCKNIGRQPHCLIECIPVPKEIGDMAPIYFKKAITESESEWSQNKKIVTITAKDGLSKAIPKGLPYFSVEFGTDGGFAHIIEEEESFPFYFGKEIIGGMLDTEPRLWRKPPKESFEQHKRKVLKFAECWKPYDWTHRLKE